MSVRFVSSINNFSNSPNLVEQVRVIDCIITQYVEFIRHGTFVIQFETNLRSDHVVDPSSFQCDVDAASYFAISLHPRAKNDSLLYRTFLFKHCDNIFYVFVSQSNQGAAVAAF